MFSADKVDTELIEVLVCSVRQAATGESPVGRAPTSRKVANAVKDARQLQEDKTRLSEILIPQLPVLLHRVSKIFFFFFETSIDIYMK